MADGAACTGRGRRAGSGTAIDEVAGPLQYQLHRASPVRAGLGACARAQRRMRRAAGGSGSPGGRSFQSAFRSAIMARRSPGSCRRLLMTMFDLTGRVAVVTGGNGGIGLGMARAWLGSWSTRVVRWRAAQRLPRKAEAAVASRTRQPRHLRSRTGCGQDEEASCRAVIDQTEKRFGRLDILVNNAGTSIRKPPGEFIPRTNGIPCSTPI